MDISLSILTMNYNHIQQDLQQFQDKLKYLHLDVMDGHFVPNLSFGPDLIRSLRKESNLFFDTHLMISNPKKYIENFVNAGSDAITIHYEIEEDLSDLIAYIHHFGIKAGIAIKPNTNVEVLQPYLADLDLVLVMSVEPGFGGQKFMESAIQKVKYLKQMKETYGYTYWISVDGGIDDHSIQSVVPYIDLAVCGSYVTSSKTPLENLIKLKHNF